MAWDEVQHQIIKRDFEVALAKDCANGTPGDVDVTRVSSSLLRRVCSETESFEFKLDEDKLLRRIAHLMIKVPGRHEILKEAIRSRGTLRARDVAEADLLLALCDRDWDTPAALHDKVLVVCDHKAEAWGWTLTKIAELLASCMPM